MKQELDKEIENLLVKMMTQAVTLNQENHVLNQYLNTYNFFLLFVRENKKNFGQSFKCLNIFSFRFTWKRHISSSCTTSQTAVSKRLKTDEQQIDEKTLVTDAKPIFICHPFAVSLRLHGDHQSCIHAFY